MRVSTQQTYARVTAYMSKLTAEADTAQTQIATGKKVLTPSDDPGAYRQIVSLKRAEADDQAYGANIALAQSVLGQSSDTLTSVETQLQRAQELFTSAANGTLSDSDRSAIARELGSIRDALMGLANSRDTRGQPIFGGADGAAPYAQDADGTIRYVATGQPADIPIGTQTRVSGGVTGDQAFAAGDKDMFAVIAEFAAALETGADVTAAAETAVKGVTDSLESVNLARTSIGARTARLELDVERLVDASEAREADRSELEDVDVATAVTQLQRTLTILQATQASFTKLSQLSLFDYLR
jgi:flagellar hook-associated protein 3 FlgL